MNRLCVALFTAILISALFTPLAISTEQTTIDYIPLELGQVQTAWSITIDGDPSEWGTFTCPTLPDDGKYGVYYYKTVNNIPQWIWCDAPGDERTDFANPDHRVDLLQFRITGDSEYIYMLFIFNDTSSIRIGDGGATFVALTINRNGTGSGEWFAGLSETKVYSDAKWLYQMVVNLADSRYNGTRPEHVSDTLRANWGAIFYLVDSDWNHITHAQAMIGANVSNNAIEIRLPWSIIGGKPSEPVFFLRLSLITARGWSDYDKNQGGTWDIKDVSDALDAMTTIGPNT